jgi:hypothetical protein
VRLDELMDEAALAVRQITGLKEVFAWPPDSLTPPAGYVSYPASVDFDEAYQRGEDRITDLPIVLVVGKATERSARDQAARWASGDGPRSLKRALEAWPWTTCDDLTVTTCEFDVERIGGVDYLAAMFKATAVGRGED